MATVTKPPELFDKRKPLHVARDARQLRRDRVTGILVIVVTLLLTALMIWLASMGHEPGMESIDWPVMP